MEKNNKLPIFYLEIDDNDESGVHAISFVDSPAIEIDWMTFKNDEKPFQFKKNEDERIITSPVMLAETPIYRIGPNGEEFYIKYSAESIMKMMKKYFKDNKIHNVNEDHNPDKVVEGVTMIESFIVGDKTTSNLYPNIPDGSWVTSFHIEDKQYWDDVIMSDDFNGLSLEGNFMLTDAHFAKIEEVKPPTDDELYADLETILNSGGSEKDILESLKEKLK